MKYLLVNRHPAVVAVVIILVMWLVISILWFNYYTGEQEQRIDDLEEIIVEQTKAIEHLDDIIKETTRRCVATGACAEEA